MMHPTTTMASITTNEHELEILLNRENGNNRVYKNLYRYAIKEYISNMTMQMESDINLGEFSEENPYDYDVAREEEVNSIVRTEDEFITAIGEDTAAVYVCRTIMKMEQVVKDFNGAELFDVDDSINLDKSVMGDIGQLYSTWIYAITKDVEFDIEYEDDEDDE